MAADRAEFERCLASGELAQALRLSEMLLASQPDDPEAQTLHASALMAKGDWQSAASLLEKALHSTQAPYVAKPRLALCWLKLGNRSDALDAFRAALAERPGDFVQRLAYAECLEAEGEGQLALPEYFRALCNAQQQGRWLSDASTPVHLQARVKRAMALADTGRHALFGQVLEPHIAAFGREAMQRVSEALSLYLGTTPAPAGDPRQRSKFFHVPSLPATPYFERGLFPWYPVLEDTSDAIGKELREVLGKDEVLTPFLGVEDADATEGYLGGDPGTRAWDAYFLYRHGRTFGTHLAQCPATAAALSRVPLTVVRDHAPEVLFSVLAPQTHIKPHHGVTNTRVVTHLPLIIPEGDCRLVVGGIAHAWQQGRCTTFDDTFLHEAWNRTDQRRVVMILDTWNPYLAPEECAALKSLIEQIGDFNASSANG